MTSSMEPDRIIFRITIKDIQEVAAQKLDRELTPEEINFIEDRLIDFIHWYDAIDRSIDELGAMNQYKR